MLSTLFSKGKANGKGFKLKFSKNENTWLVIKGHSIMFMGGEEQCKTYISNFA